MRKVLTSYVELRSAINLETHLWTTFELLLVGFLSTFLVWYIQFLWRRRKLYEHANKMPGPFALPLIGCAHYFLGDTYGIFCNIMKLFNTYPGIFRVWFGPRLFYAVSDPKYYEILLPNCLTKEYLYHYAEPVVGHGLFTAPVTKWKKHRKAIMPTFNQKILDGFVEVFSEQANIFVEQLQKHCGTGEFDIFHMMFQCTLDTICETAMGVKVNAQTIDAPYSRWTDRIFEIVFLRIFVIWYHFDAIFNLTSLAKEEYNVVKNMHAFSGTVVRKKKRAYDAMMKRRCDDSEIYFQEEPRRKAFLDYLLELTSNENSKFTEQELREEVDTFIIAGSDTTASTNSFTFIMLGLHQDLQQKVYDELVEVVGPDRSIQPADLPKLRYMERFIKETLRLFPVAAFVVRAIEEDISIGDHMLVGGSSVVFGFLKTHTDEKYWPDPYRFDPDRFLPEEVAKRHPCAYVPFSYGSRNCAGMKYAMMAMKAVLATVLRKYKIFTSYKSIKDIKLKSNLVLRPKDGYKVSIELRN